LSAAFDLLACLNDPAQLRSDVNRKFNRKFKSGGQECPPHTGMEKILSGFSFSFHKEVPSSTVSAQLNNSFPLRLIRPGRKVLTVQA
jgi:hypothetical protein